MIIGLTGGIASGKSTVSAHFERLGIDIVDADVVARQVVEPGTPALDKIVEHFGQQILCSDDSLNRAALRERIFENEADKSWLNALLHPLIRQQMLNQLRQANSSYSVLVAPLLVENKLERLVDRVLVVDVPEALQIQRTIERDKVSAQHAKSIISAQASRATRLAAADDTIINDAGTEQLLSKVEALHQRYLELAKHH